LAVFRFIAVKVENKPLSFWNGKERLYDLSEAIRFDPESSATYDSMANLVRITFKPEEEICSQSFGEGITTSRIAKS